MLTRPKRSERLGINLTPDQYQQIRLAAKKAKRTPATYAYNLLCQALDSDGPVKMEEEETTSEWVESLGELYGVLDALTEQLAGQSEAGHENPNVQELLNEINEQIESIQQTLRLMPFLMAGEQE